MIEEYLQTFKLQITKIIPIIHKESISSAVYRISLKNQKTVVLKICYNQDRYRKELYFLKILKSRFPVPKILDVLEPSQELKGAILMECLPGFPLSISRLTSALAFKMGVLLGQLHGLGAEKYGDLSKAEEVLSDPIHELSREFEESIDECKNILSSSFLRQARHYFETHMPLAESLDGPCIVHRDFKPGNIMAEKEIIQGVIDWEIARGGFAEEDFVRMDRLVWTKNQASKEFFLEGYKSIRPLPDIENILPFLRVVSALGAIGFTARRNTWNTDHKTIFETNKAFLEQELL